MTLHVFDPGRPAGMDSPRIALPLVQEPEDGEVVGRLPMSTDEAKHHAAVRLVVLALTLDEYGLEDYAADLRYLAAGLVADLPADRARRR